MVPPLFCSLLSTSILLVQDTLPPARATCIHSSNTFMHILEKSYRIFFNANLIMPLASLFSLNICLLNFKKIYIFNNLHDLELSSPSASLISSWDKFSPHSLSFFLVKISPIPQVLHSYPLLTRFCPSI